LWKSTPSDIAREFTPSLSPRDEFQSNSPQEVGHPGRRKKFSNPRKDFSFSVNITPINQKIEDQIDLSDIKRKNVPLVEDLETLVYFFRENQIEVTIKNRWIPFKYLKLIEEKFISPDKDSFNLLGKEENRGEEPFKNLPRNLTEKKSLNYY